MKYIASCSFGKDSLAMILTIIEHGLPLDEVVYREVMFDDTTSGEYPEHADFIHNKAIPILELVYGLKVTVLRAKTNYKERLARLNTKGKHIGEPRGFPLRLGPWCNSELRACLISRRMPAGEGFSRQARRDFAGIIGFISRNLNEAWREKIRRMAF